MEFRHITLYALALLCCAALAGCSSSDGYVDYTSIEKPSETHTDTADEAHSTDSAAQDSAESNSDQDTRSETDRAVSDGKPVTEPADQASATSPDIAEPQTDISSDAVAQETGVSESKAEDSSNDVKMVAGDSADGGPVERAVARVESADSENGQAPTPEDDSSTTGTPQPAAKSPTDDQSGQSPATKPSANDTGLAELDDDTPAEPREIKLLIPEKRFRREGDTDVLRVTYDDIDLLKVLNMQPVPVDAVDHFPQWLRDLDGKRIRLRGFMFPTFVATGIKKFGLARDNGICCFVKQPKIYDMIDVSLAQNETTDYIEGKPFDVEGTFRIDPVSEGSELFQLYRIEDAKVLTQ